MAKFFLILILICAATGANANAVKQYPPYPDVWGYDLSGHQAVRDNRGGVFGAYKLENGDCAFSFRSRVVEKSLPNVNGNKRVEFKKYGWLHFFENSIKEISLLEVFGLVHNLPSVSYLYNFGLRKITFSNGHTIEQKELDGCMHADIGITKFLISSYLSKKDEKGNEFARYSIIVATPKASMYEEREYCGDAGCGIQSPDGYYYAQLYYFPSQIFKLEDDTFIAYYKNLIIRFDQNLQTKFHPKVNYRLRDGRILKRNFFVLPYEKVEEIYLHVVQSGIPWSQGVQDKLMDYLIENYNE